MAAQEQPQEQPLPQQQSQLTEEEEKEGEEGGAPELTNKSSREEIEEGMLKWERVTVKWSKSQSYMGTIYHLEVTPSLVTALVDWDDGTEEGVKVILHGEGAAEWTSMKGQLTCRMLTIGKKVQDLLTSAATSQGGSSPTRRTPNLRVSSTSRWMRAACPRAWPKGSCGTSWPSPRA